MSRTFTHRYRLAALSTLLLYCHSGEHRNLESVGDAAIPDPLRDAGVDASLRDGGDSGMVGLEGSSGGGSGGTDGGFNGGAPNVAGADPGGSGNGGASDGGSCDGGSCDGGPCDGGPCEGGPSPGGSSPGGSSNGGTCASEPCGGSGGPIVVQDSGPHDAEAGIECDAESDAAPDAAPDADSPCEDGGIDCTSGGLSVCVDPDTGQPATAIACVPGTDCIHLRVINTKADIENNICGKITSDVNGLNAIYSPYGYSFSFNPIDDYEERTDTLLRDDCSLSSPITSYTDPNTPPPCDPVPNEVQRLSVADGYPTRLVIYVTTNYQPTWGGSSWVWETTPSHSSMSGNFVALEAVADPAEPMLIAHELGHYFHLRPTHSTEYTLDQLQAAICAEIDASPSLTFSEAFEGVADGDRYLVGDTPPDPSYPFFSDPCSDPEETELSVRCTSRSGMVLVAPDRSNLMSDHVKDCTGPVVASLSPDQVADIDSAVTTGNRSRLLGGADWITSLPAFTRGGPGVRITVVNPMGGVSDASLSVGETEPFDLTRSVFDGDVAPDSVSTVEVNGNFHILGRTNSGFVAHKWWDGSNWNPSLGGWTTLGGTIAGRPAAVGLNGTELHLFVRLPDNTIGHRSFTTSWSEWENLGGIHRGDPAAVSWGPNRIDIVSRGEDSRLWHKAWIGSWWPPGTDWLPITTYPVGTTTDSPAIASWGVNRLDIAARGTNGNLWYRAWTGTVWTDWVDIGGPIQGSPSLTTWGPNHLDIVVRGANNQVLGKTWNGSWLPSDTTFTDLGASAIKPPVVFSEASGTLRYYTVGTDNNLWTRVYDGAWAPTSGWSYLGRL